MELKVGDKVVVIYGFKGRHVYGVPTSEAKSDRRTGTIYYVKTVDWFGSKLIEVVECSSRRIGMIFPEDCLRKVGVTYV